MLIDLTKRLKLKKNFQREKAVINLLSKVNCRFFEKRKNNFNQFVEVFDNLLKKIYIDIVFEMNNEFIYYVDERRCLCIFVACEQKVFRIIHNKNQHSKRHRCYQRIADIFYVFKLSRKLRLYIEHCSLC